MEKYTVKSFDEMPCKYRKKDGDRHICMLATQQDTKEIPVVEGQCTSCMRQGGPDKPDNKAIKYARMVAKSSNQHNVRKKAEEYFGEGPGTELKKMIPDWMEKPGCDCRNFAKKMNIWGING